MPTKDPVPSENLGKTLETFGGKSQAKLYGGIAAIAAPALAAFIFALVKPEYRAPAIAAGCVLVLIALVYVATNLIAVGMNVEVCEQGIHVFRRGAITSLRWDDIALVEVGRSMLNNKTRWGVMIYGNGGECIDLGPGFWDAAGQPSKFVNVIKRFVPRVQMN